MSSDFAKSDKMSKMGLILAITEKAKVVCNPKAKKSAGVRIACLWTNVSNYGHSVLLGGN
jgi:hypothetical protein